MSEQQHDRITAWATAAAAVAAVASAFASVSMCVVARDTLRATNEPQISMKEVHAQIDPQTKLFRAAAVIENTGNSSARIAESTFVLEFDGRPFTASDNMVPSSSVIGAHQMVTYRAGYNGDRYDSIMNGSVKVEAVLDVTYTSPMLGQKRSFHDRLRYDAPSKEFIIIENAVTEHP